MIKKFLIENKDLLIILAVTIVGWFIVFYLNLRQQKKHLQNSAKMKVYEELHNLKKDIDEAGEILGLSLTKFSLPFLSMSFEKDSTAVSADLKAIQRWNKYALDLGENIHNFVGSYLKLWNHSDMWIGVMPQIKLAKKELFEVQFKNLTDKLNKHQHFIQDQSVKEFYWKKWDRTEIEDKTKEISTLFDQMAVGYLDDYLGLIHNRLVAPIFKYKKIPRENFANLDKVDYYFILTENGLKKILVKK